MSDIIDIAFEVLCNGISITGMVIVLMMLIEFLNRGTHGSAFRVLGQSRLGQVVLGAGLGLVPGCFGGFAVVSMYSHKVIGFGALVAMMIATSGDEAFFMLAMIPKEALIVSAIIFILAIISGLLVDYLFKGEGRRNSSCGVEMVWHDDDHTHDDDRDMGYKGLCGARFGTVAVLLLFMGYFLYTFFANGASGAAEAGRLNLDFVNERWLNMAFAVASLGIAIAAFFMPVGIVRDNLWNHVIRKHLLPIFLWTAGTLFVIQIGLHYFDIATWTSANTLWMIVLAALVGMIPESGPHLIFVSLFATGSVPFSVLLTSCISQDGHAGLPLLAEDRRGFVIAKLTNAAIALAAGVVAYSIGF